MGHDYIFPNKIAKFMASISQRTQMESTMMSLTFILIGLVVFTVYVIGFSTYGIWAKIGIGLNSFFGIILLGSYLVTAYQQYNNYKMIMGLYKKEETTPDYV